MHENRGETVKNNNNNGSLYRFAYDYKDLFLDYMDPITWVPLWIPLIDYMVPLIDSMDLHSGFNGSPYRFLA